MRFSYQIGMCDPDHYLPLARAAEQAVFHGIAVSDSICYPQEASSKYPYNEDGSRDFLESVPFVESLISVAAMAAVTERIRFATFVYKLAVRQAPVVAKQVQGIQALSGNRFDFGIGISPWEEDFAVCEVPWEKRGKRFDEQIEILRGLESGEFFGYQGEMHNMPSNKMNPVPAVPTDLLIGGHAEPALKRAARSGNGWMCAGADMQQLEAYIGLPLRIMRTPAPSSIHGQREGKDFERYVTRRQAYWTSKTTPSFCLHGLVQFEATQVQMVILR